MPRYNLVFWWDLRLGGQRSFTPSTRARAAAEALPHRVRPGCRRGAPPLSSRSILTHAKLRKRERVTLDW